MLPRGENRFLDSKPTEFVIFSSFSLLTIDPDLGEEEEFLFLQFRKRLFPERKTEVLDANLILEGG
jgi:hypothetical protein